MNAATPGEWNRDTHPQEPIIASRTEGETWYSIAPVCQVCYGDWTEGDAEFIAAAPADIRYLLARVAALEAALTPFAAVGAAVAALRDVRPQSSYAPEHAALTIGGATVTFAHLIAAADVLAVRAEAVTGGASGKGAERCARNPQAVEQGRQLIQAAYTPQKMHHNSKP